jgi:hypothetical protein
MLTGVADPAVHFASSIILRSKKYVTCLGTLLTKYVAVTDLSTNNSILKGRTVVLRTDEQHTISALSIRKGSLVGLTPDWADRTLLRVVLLPRRRLFIIHTLPESSCSPV